MEKKVNEMGEQEKYTRMLKNLIDDTESHKIKSTEEIIRKLVKELTNNTVHEHA